MGKPESVIEKFVLAAGILGFLQSAAWIGLAIKAIVMHYSDEECSKITVGCLIYLGYIMHLDKPDDKDPRIINQTNFVIFIYIYLVLNVIWLIVSTLLIWGVTRDNNRSCKYRNGAWSGITVVISLLDVVLMFLLAYDYTLVNENYNSLIGIVMSIAARGYVLWVVNIAFAVILGKSSYNHCKTVPTNDRPYINAFGSTNRLPWEVQTFGAPDNNNQNGESNKGFKNDTSDFMFMSTPFGKPPQTNQNNESSLMRQPLPNPPSNNYQGMSNNSALYNRPYSFPERPLRPFTSSIDGMDSQPNQQWARPSHAPSKFSNPPSRFSGFQDNGPFIPDPDYSPPSSARMKGVLRPSSNYIL